MQVLKWLISLKPLGPIPRSPDTDWLHRKIARVKRVAGQINDLYKKKYGDDLTGATARSVVGVQTWAYVLNRAGFNRPQGHSEVMQLRSTFRGYELVMPWDGIKFDANRARISKQGLDRTISVEEGKAILNHLSL